MAPLLLIRRVTLLFFILWSTIIRENGILSSFVKSEDGAEDSPLKEDTSPDDEISGNLRTSRSPVKNRSAPPAQFGLVVAHCREKDMSWIDEIENITLGEDSTNTTWDAVVYERCDQPASDKYSEAQRNLGSEECSAYLRYILDRYDNLPEIVYFLQPDALGYNNEKGHASHTNFATLQELVSASAPLMMEPPTTEAGTDKSGGPPKGYVNFGNMAIDETRLVSPEGPNDNPVEILELMKERAPVYDDSTMLELVPGACFGVRRERILAQPLQYYKDLMLRLVLEVDVRWTCFSLEATWHVIFGEGLKLSPTSTIQYHLNADASRAASTSSS